MKERLLKAGETTLNQSCSFSLMKTMMVENYGMKTSMVEIGVSSKNYAFGIT